MMNKIGSRTFTDKLDRGWAINSWLTGLTAPSEWRIASCHRWVDRRQEILSRWGDYSEKCLWGKSHSLFLQRSLSAGTNVATCRLTRVGAASWVNSNNQITLTANCNCWASLSSGVRLQATSPMWALHIPAGTRSPAVHSARTGGTTSR